RHTLSWFTRKPAVQQVSMTTAAPMPPPAHNETTPIPPPRDSDRRPCVLRSAPPGDRDCIRFHDTSWECPCSARDRPGSTRISNTLNYLDKSWSIGEGCRDGAIDSA